MYFSFYRLNSVPIDIPPTPHPPTTVSINPMHLNTTFKTIRFRSPVLIYKTVYAFTSFIFYSN